MSELAHLMEEPPGGENHGRQATTDPNLHGRQTSLDADDWQAAEFMRGGGWGIVTHAGGEWKRAGGSDHRGVLHPDEYVNEDALRPMVERELGFTYEQVRSVYRQGPLSADGRELRGRVDARLLVLSRSGANLALLGAALGFPIKDNGNCRAMENALARARAKEITP